MTIDVTVDGGRVQIPHSVFFSLLDSSVVHGRNPYLRALQTRRIALHELIDLARKAEIPYSLFFAPLEVVEAQLDRKTVKLLQGVSPETFTVNSRTKIDLRDVELIVKDLLRKQDLLQTHDNTLTRNPIVGLLKKPRRTVAEDAEALIFALELDREAIWALGKSETALERIIACLEARGILVSRSVQGYMPQRVEVHFSGMTVRHARAPYIFLAGGDHGDNQEPVGRQIFTLILMTVLVARGIFAPVTYDAQSSAPGPGREFDITGEILMPAAEVKRHIFASLDEVKIAAKRFKVTPTAMTVRAQRLGAITQRTAMAYRAELDKEYSQREKVRFGQPSPFNAVRKYASRGLSVRMLAAVEAGTLTPSEFCRVVTLKKLSPSELGKYGESL
jgi:hypothetical protein